MVAKGGYIQGQNMKLARERQFPDVVEYGQGIWHSIHPEFLETQIERSARRLRLQTIDVYLLHNPEYYLEHEAHNGGIGGKHINEFYRRIREAFRFLELQVAAGRIRWYGISSNNFPLPASNSAMTSVHRCSEAARSITPDHHFRVVQLPMNLYESGGALESNNSGQSVLQFCGERGIGVLLNRPLNAFYASRMTRLADFLGLDEAAPGKERLHDIVSPLRDMEEGLHEQFEIPLIHGHYSGIASYIEAVVSHIESPAQWEQAFFEYIVQPIDRWAVQCRQLYGDSPEWQAWWNAFAQRLPAVFAEIAKYVAALQQTASDSVRERLKLAGYPMNGESLSQMAENVLLNLPGVSSVLVGMRRVEYVEDSLKAVGLGAVDGISILSNFRLLNSEDPLLRIQ